MKKILSVLLAVAMLAALCCACVSCGKTTEEGDAAVTLNGDMVKADAPVEADTTLDKSDFKIGFILLHDENSTYDKNFIDAANAACAALGLTADQIAANIKAHL